MVHRHILLPRDKCTERVNKCECVRVLCVHGRFHAWACLLPACYWRHRTLVTELSGKDHHHLKYTPSHPQRHSHPSGLELDTWRITKTTVANNNMSKFVHIRSEWLLANRITFSETHPASTPQRQITPPSHAQINIYINSCALSLSPSCMSFTPTTPTMYPIFLRPTHVNNSYIPSPSISSIPSTNPTPLYLQTQTSRLPNTNTVRHPLPKKIKIKKSSLLHHIWT